MLLFFVFFSSIIHNCVKADETNLKISKTVDSLLSDLWRLTGCAPPPLHPLPLPLQCHHWPLLDPALSGVAASRPSPVLVSRDVDSECNRSSRDASALWPNVRQEKHSWLWCWRLPLSGYCSAKIFRQDSHLLFYFLRKHRLFTVTD